MKRYRSILGIAFVAAGAACAHEAPIASAPIEAQSPKGCPLARLREVSATVADMPGGVAVTFYVPPDEVPRVRQIVDRMAYVNDSQNNAFAECPCGITSRVIGNAERMAPDITSGGTADDFAPPP